MGLEGMTMTRTKLKNYKVTRRRTIKGQLITQIFSWEEGDGYIAVKFPGCYDHDAIQVWDYDTNTNTITGRDQFIAEVAEFMKDTDPETTLECWTYRMREQQ